MEIDIQNLPDSPDLLREMIIELSEYKEKYEQLEDYKKKYEQLEDYKKKYEQLVKALRLAKQERFAPSSEKNIFQADFFDEPGTELPEAVKEQLAEEVEV